MKRYRRGLVVGKFSPLHFGHEHLLRTAADACDEVYVYCYAKPELPECNAERRLKWLRSRFPALHHFVVTDENLPALLQRENWPSVPHEADGEDCHRRFVAELYLATVGRPLDVVFTSENYGPGFVSVVNEVFRSRGVLPATVKHIEVDQARRIIPISATAIRENPFAARQFLAPEIYADFVRTICLLGAESTGKTTLAAALAERLGAIRVDEYGRQLWVERAGKLSFLDMAHIAEQHVAHEDRARCESNRFLIVDTSPLTTLYYSLYYFSDAPEVLRRLADRRYDLTFLCLPDIPYVQDGTREGEEFRLRQHAWYIEELARRRISYTRLAGPLEARLEEVQRVIGQSGVIPS